MGFLPALMPIISGVSAVAGIAGAGMSAIGGAESAEAQAANLQYQAAVAANNGTAARQNAEWETQAGEVSAANKGLQTRAQVGQEKAATGGAGIDVNTGSTTGVLAATAEFGQNEALTIRSNSARKAYGYQVQAGSDVAQAGLDTQGAQQEQQAAPIIAATSLLSGASTVGSSFGRYQLYNPGATAGPLIPGGI